MNDDFFAGKEVAYQPNYWITHPTPFTFLDKVPNLEQFDGQATLKAVEGKEKEAPQYRLQLDARMSRLKKQQLLQLLDSSSVNAKKTLIYHPNAIFAIQTHDNQFLSVANDQLQYAPHITPDSYFLVDFNAHGHVYDYNTCDEGGHFAPHESSLIASSRSNYQGGLFYDANNQQLQYDPNNNFSSAANAPFNFDWYGHLTAPGTLNTAYKAFTLMPYIQRYIDCNNDPRQFIAARANGLFGDTRVPWDSAIWYRYVQVIEGVKIGGQYFADTYLAAEANGDMGLRHVPANQTAPGEVLFDMYVHYGNWSDRKNIYSKVVFRSRHTGKCISIKTDNSVRCDVLHHAHHEELLAEVGWGGHVNDVQLKTFWGKYLAANGDLNNPYIFASSVTPLNWEQFDLELPFLI